MLSASTVISTHDVTFLRVENVRQFVEGNKAKPVAIRIGAILEEVLLARISPNRILSELVVSYVSMYVSMN